MHGGDTSNLYDKFRKWLCNDSDIDWKSIMKEDSHIQYQAGDTSQMVYGTVMRIFVLRKFYPWD